MMHSSSRSSESGERLDGWGLEKVATHWSGLAATLRLQPGEMLKAPVSHMGNVPAEKQQPGVYTVQAAPAGPARASEDSTPATHRQAGNRPLFRQRIAMRIPGQRIKRTRLIQTEQYVVAVEVEMVIPVDDPSEPYYESETVQLLREIKEHAERGDVAWLTQKGKVYAAVGAA